MKRFSIEAVSVSSHVIWKAVCFMTFTSHAKKNKEAAPPPSPSLASAPNLNLYIPHIFSYTTINHPPPNSTNLRSHHPLSPGNWVYSTHCHMCPMATRGRTTWRGSRAPTWWWCCSRCSRSQTRIPCPSQDLV